MPPARPIGREVLSNSLRSLLQTIFHASTQPLEFAGRPKVRLTGLREVNAMVEGRISTIDVKNRTAVITEDNGRELTVHFPEGVSIEVSELETVGTVGGELEDLDVGYLVELEVGESHSDGSCTCASLVSIS